MMLADVNFFWPDMSSTRMRKRRYLSILFEVSQGIQNRYDDIFLFVFACRFFEYFIILNEILQSGGDSLPPSVIAEMVSRHINTVYASYCSHH